MSCWIVDEDSLQFWQTGKNSTEKENQTVIIENTDFFWLRDTADGNFMLLLDP